MRKISVCVSWPWSIFTPSRWNCRMQSYLFSSFELQQRRRNDFRHNLHPPLVLLWTGGGEALARVGRPGQIPSKG